MYVQLLPNATMTFFLEIQNSTPLSSTSRLAAQGYFLYITRQQMRRMQTMRRSDGDRLPPSGYKTWAFRNKPPGPARKRMQAAMSESCPVRPAGLDMDMSSLDFWSSPDEPAVISLGKMPGAMQLTRILVSAKVVAIIRVMWMKPERWSRA